MISAAEFDRELRGALRPVVLDARWHFRGPPAVEDYRRGHVTDARFVDVDADLAGTCGGGLLPLPSSDQFGAAMRRLGVSARRPVVVYDERDATSAAARAWWMLRFFGHPDVRVLNGGLAAWTAGGFPLSNESVCAEAGDFDPKPGRMRVVDADGAAGVASAGILLDARSIERFRGQEEPYFPPAGHIPGALSSPASRLVTPSGQLQAEEELRRYFDLLGIADAPVVGAYCGAGVTAAQTILALDTIGIEAALYVGSWSDWVAVGSRQIASAEG